MRIEGNLATYEFSDLLQWLAQGNKSGILTVSDGGVEYRLGFDHGRIDMSSSSDPEQRLDSFLFSKGVIDQATLARAERLREATQMMSGQVLVTLGAVTEMQLAQALRDKTEAILCELLTWERGSFIFEGGDRPKSTSSMVPISLEVTKLLLESMHRLDQRHRGVEPPPAVVTVPEPALPADATQAIAGLALAEVLDPEAAPEPAGVADRMEEPAAAALPPHYAVMAQDPGPIRRLMPATLVVLLSLSIGAFYLANIEASAQAVDVTPTGEPILFTQTAGPLPAGGEPVGAEPVAAAAPVAATEPVASDAQEVLRRRYERQLADLRKELEETRRLVEPPAREPLVRAAAGDGSPVELPADSMIRASVSQPPAEQLVAAEPAVVAPSATSEDSAPAMTPPVSVVEAAGPGPAVAAPAETLAAADTAAAAPSFDFVNPVLLSRPAPGYPTAARRLKRGATVTVRVHVGVDGRVEEVERVGPKAGMGFDRAAEQAALASLWKPGTRGGEPTPMWADLRFEFNP